MELFLSAVLGDLTSRSIDFIIKKCSKPPELAAENHLQRALLRAEVIVDEAMGRMITNQAMLLQLNMLRDAMHRGHYALDTFRYKPQDEGDANKHQAVSSHPSSLSKVNSALRLCFSSRDTQALKELKDTLENLSSIIVDINELVIFLTSYPRLYCQPCSMHLQLANCMFGRQMEAQIVINFLLRLHPCGAEEELEVLPIVGPSRVGKSTLVAHVCKDERVTNHFSKILFLQNRGLVFTDNELATFREGCVGKDGNHVLNLDREAGRLLVVVELGGDLDEDSWNRLYSSAKKCVPNGSKIIVTSQFEKITKFGTTEAMTLKHLSDEAYWYFFKTLAFGSTDPRMHPRLVNLALEIAGTQRSSLCGGNVIACLLRDNFDIHFWRKVLAFLRGSYQRHLSRFGMHPFERLRQNQPAHLGRMATPSDDLLLYRQYQRSSEEEVPKIRIQDVMYGNVRPHGKFELLAWQSVIPPYHSFVYACEIRETKTTAAKRKRIMG